MPSRLFGEGAVMSELMSSVPQYIGIGRRARSETLRPARYHQPRFGAGDCPKREIADGQRNPGFIRPFEQDNFSDADLGGNLARQRQGLPQSPLAPGQMVERGKREGPPCSERLIRRTR